MYYSIYRDGWNESVGDVYNMSLEGAGNILLQYI